MTAVVLLTSAPSYGNGVQVGDLETILFYRDDFSSDGVGAWDVDFGDGSPHVTGASSDNYYGYTTHAYAAPGIYTVTVVTALGTASADTYINPIQSRIAFYAAGDYDFGTTVVGEVTGNSGGVENHFTVDWGDGTVEDFTTTESYHDFTHNYAAPGSYTATATNTTAYGTVSWTNLVNIVVPVPEIWTVNPDSGFYGRVGELVLVRGDKLDLVTSISFGGAPQPFDLLDSGHLRVVLTSTARSGDVTLSPSGPYTVFHGFVISYDGPWVEPGGTETVSIGDVHASTGGAFEQHFLIIEDFWGPPPDLDHPYGSSFGGGGWISSGITGLAMDGSDNASMSWTNGNSYVQQLVLDVAPVPELSWPHQPFFRYRLDPEPSFAERFDIPLPVVDTSDPNFLEVHYDPPTILGIRVTGVLSDVPEVSARTGSMSFGDYSQSYSGPPQFAPLPPAPPLVRWRNITFDPEPLDGWTNFTPNPADIALLDPLRLPYKGWKHQAGTLTGVVETYAEVAADATVVFEVAPGADPVRLEVCPVSMDLNASNGRYVPFPDYNAYAAAHFNDTPFVVRHGYDYTTLVPTLTGELLYRPGRYRVLYSTPRGTPAGWSVGRVR